jgi:glutathione synthase
MKPGRFLFVLDPLASLKPAKDSSIAMMRALAARGHSVLACEPAHLVWDGHSVVAHAQALKLNASGHDWCAGADDLTVALHTLSACLMRKDPPVDSEFLYATHLLSAAARAGAKVFNNPSALRDHNEKLAILEFPEFTAPTIVTSDAARIRRFLTEQGQIVLKPLDGMGGTGIYRLTETDPNLGVILETASLGGQRTLMAQRYLPDIARGDKRILLIDGEPIAYCLARVPKPGESRGNLAAGGTGHAQPLSDRDRDIATALGPRLAARGLFLVGLDVIGDCLTEINVTSPTCMVEISTQSGIDVAGRFVDALERHLEG